MKHNATNEGRERFWLWLVGLLLISAMLSMTSNLQTGTQGLLLGVAVASESERKRIWPWQRVWRVKNGRMPSIKPGKPIIAKPNVPAKWRSWRWLG